MRCSRNFGASQCLEKEIVPKDLARTSLSLAFSWALMLKAKGVRGAFSSYPPLSIPNSLQVFRWSAYIILSRTKHLSICIFIPSLNLLKCTLLSEMLSSNSRGQTMRELATAALWFIMHSWIPWGTLCYAIYLLFWIFIVLYIEWQWEVGYGRKKEDSLKRPRGLEQRDRVSVQSRAMASPLRPKWHSLSGQVTQGKWLFIFTIPWISTCVRVFLLENGCTFQIFPLLRTWLGTYTE